MKAQQRERLIELLEGVAFDRRYYGFCENGPTLADVRGLSIEDDEIAAVVETAKVDFEPGEKKGVHRHVHSASPAVELEMTIKFPYVDFALVAVPNGSQVGAPYARLARAVAERRDDPTFIPSTRTPRALVSDRDELEGAVSFGVDLFQDAARVILGNSWS